MWTAGWTGLHWIQLLTLLASTFHGHILVDGQHEAIKSDSIEGRQSVCLARDWRDVEAEQLQLPICVETRWRIPDGSKPPDQTATSWAASTSASAAPTSAEQELDTDSPLDNVNFLSFEDWKKQNLAKAGQWAETVAGKRGDETGREERRRPTGINNALESLGEDAEIELDFGGFGDGSPETTKPTAWAGRTPHDLRGSHDGGEIVEDSASQEVAGAGASHGRDAGTTCKERFNYASFDCAATVLKTNPECQGSSSILTENKDSYMLNECRAKNKFLIFELCDDILVDTVVLANYEFFSSIFHTFRVSVADRYPAKPDQWKELGVYEARNTREVQAFAIENPLIWARYLKIELLTHYGNEFYCPLSLVRVHGTTMLEEYKHDGDAARSDIESIEGGPWVEIEGGDSGSSEEVTQEDQSKETYNEVFVCPNHLVQVEALLKGGCEVTDECSIYAAPVNATGSARPNECCQPPGNGTAFVTAESTPVEFGPEPQPNKTDHVEKPSGHTANITSTAETVSETGQRNASETDTKPVTQTKEEYSTDSTRTSTTQPPAPNPTTQESFFKSVNKRLQMLESNSTLSLLYIEEQSRILRDAFNKVEKRQLAKTSTFLESLNVTVLNELRQFREQYDQVWKSVVFEFEHQRIQYHQEIYAMSSQLGVLADELVFQKRVSVIQSLMVLFCFGLVLFSRGAVSNYIELPSVQNMVSRTYSFRSSSPSGSPASTRPGSSGRSGHRRNLSDESPDGPPSPTIAYSPPTPASSSSEEPEEMDQAGPDALQVPDIDPQFRSQSTPPVLSGSGEVEDAA